MNVLKTILKIVVTTINWLITIAVILAVVGMVILPMFGIKPYVVLSGSMEPAIPAGSVAWIDVNDTDVEKGDVVAYLPESGSLYVTHRIVDEKGDRYVFKGDANETVDLNTVGQEQIYGQYRFCIPGLGKFLTTLKGNPYLAIPILAVVLAVILLENLVS